MESLAVRRLASLSQHLKACIVSNECVKAKLSAGDEVTQAFQVEVEKLRNSSNRLVTEVHKLFQSGPNSETVTQEMTTSLAEANELQIAAEDLIVELDIYLKSNITSSRDEPRAASTLGGHLPKLQLASFSGDILKWTEFWDRFSSVVDRRTDIPDVDKLAYLVCSLEGSAKQSIHGLEMTNANYKVAVQKLNERFGKPNLIVDAHYAALGRIPVAKNTTIDCRRVLDTVERHLRTLENLGENVNHNQLRTTIMEKFPQEVIYELRMDMETQGYSVKTLRDSLEKILSARENSFAMSSVDVAKESGDVFTTEAFVTTVENRKPKSKGFERNPRNSGRSQQRQMSSSRHSLAHNKSRPFVSNVSFSSRSLSNKRRNDRQQSPRPAPKKRKLECVYCNGDHYNDACKEASTLDARKRILLREKLCFVCLRSDHMAENCTYKRKCFHCSVYGDHNRSICPSRGIQTNNMLASA
uniref:Uncharacterized protein n=1 Tax=Cacopsylla melanoneura TaxID=428564 RepID=A0A8D8QQZ3_9HEMI